MGGTEIYLNLAATFRIIHSDERRSDERKPKHHGLVSSVSGLGRGCGPRSSHLARGPLTRAR